MEVRLEGLEREQDDEEEIVLMMIDESPLLPEARAFQKDVSEQDASTKTLLKGGAAVAATKTTYSQTGDTDALRAMQQLPVEEPTSLLLLKS